MKKIYDSYVFKNLKIFMAQLNNYNTYRFFITKNSLIYIKPKRIRTFRITYDIVRMLIFLTPPNSRIIYCVIIKKLLKKI